jgi:hypothetical protein
MELRSRAHYLNIVNAIMCKNEPIEPKLSRALVGLVGWWGVFFVESAWVGHRCCCHFVTFNSVTFTERI